MKLKIKRWDLESIEKHALKVFPFECCGLLVGKMGKEIFDVKEVVQAENVQSLRYPLKSMPNSSIEQSMRLRQRGLS